MSKNVEQKNDVVTSQIDIFKSLKNKKNEPVTINDDTRTKLSTLDTKSKMIRFLAKEGYKVGQIATILDIRYQHVYNVLNTVTKN